MKITAVAPWSEAMPLTRPYEIASMRIASVELLFLRLTTDEGLEGVGSASPAEEATGESPAAFLEALGEVRPAWLEGRDPRDPGPPSASTPSRDGRRRRRDISVHPP